jgi:hypothetical protein
MFNIEFQMHFQIYFNLVNNNNSGYPLFKENNIIVERKQKNVHKTLSGSHIEII